MQDRWSQGSTEVAVARLIPDSILRCHSGTRTRDTTHQPDTTGHISHQGSWPPLYWNYLLLVTSTAIDPEGSRNTWGLKQAGTAEEQTWASCKCGTGRSPSETNGYRFGMASKIISSCFLFIIRSHEITQSLGYWFISFHVCRQQTTWWVLTQAFFKTILLNEYISIFPPILSFFSYNRRRKTRMLLLQGIYQFLFLYFTPKVTILSTAINCDVSRRIDFCLHGLPHMAE